MAGNLRIEDYAFISNCASGALVGSNGSIDWLCLPRFDSGACFAALLGSEENGRWLISPRSERPDVKRQYRPESLVLETEFTTPEGRCVLVDCMHLEDSVKSVYRMVRGISGSVPMRMELTLRPDYGAQVPWVTRLNDGRLRAIAGPDMFVLQTVVDFRGEGMKTVAEFDVREGEEIPFGLLYCQSFRPLPEARDIPAEVEEVDAHWRKWCEQHQPQGPYAEASLRALLTLKGLTDYVTGGMVAAPTTSLPESIGGQRNWDYRYCWLRDATFTLFALLNAGFTEEASAWRDWLLRAAAGSPDQLQIMYGVAGERRLTEFELAWLGGYENSKPVRVGNAASEQFQLDVFGEVLDLLYQARSMGLGERRQGLNVESMLVEHVCSVWNEPDAGIWEMRGSRRHFTHSKVMAWVALDRGVRMAERFGLKCQLEQWRKLRGQIHQEVCDKGFDAKLNSFTQYFGGDTLDASLLMLPLVGFLPAEDPRIRSTIAAIERVLLRDGFVKRYNTDQTEDGVGGHEGVFLPCSFWLVDNYILQGRRDEARQMFERLLALRNDVGLLSEEYDPKAKRMLGNFPQAFSLVSMVNTAHNLSREDEGPAAQRASMTAQRV